MIIPYYDERSFSLTIYVFFFLVTAEKENKEK